MPEVDRPSDPYEAREAKRVEEEEEMLNRSVTINGYDLQVRDLFPDGYSAREFVGKLDLMAKAAGEKRSTLVEDQLFGEEG